MQKKYEPIPEITKRLFGYKPNPTTLGRWVHGANAGGRRLHAIKLGNRLHSTEEDVIAYLTVGGDDDSETAGTTKQPKARSEKARAKAVEAANAELERAGV